MSHYKKINISQINEDMKEYMSDHDITHYLGEDFSTNIIKYSEIENYRDIDDLLNGNHVYKIILIEDSYNSGHWVALLKYDSTIEYFNSYGLKPTVELDGNSYLKNKQLNQDVKYLNILLNNALGKYKIIYNKRKFQKSGDNIATCGRHVVFRCLMFDKFDMNLYEYIDFINLMMKKLNLSSDQLVTFFINSH